MMRCWVVFMTMLFLSACDDKRSAVIMGKLHDAQKRLAIASAPLKNVYFSPDLMSDNDYADVQSPFVPRKFIHKADEPIEVLAGLRWRLAGEVRKKGVLLGVFIRSQEKSLYCGVGLPFEHSLWRVLSVSQKVIVFENSVQNRRWKLFYESASQRTVL